jgi:class 3 adenylate cyclase/Flp pilus assembly protein TadD
VSPRTAAVFAADVVGYSRLISDAEEETLHRLTDLQALCAEAISRHDGRTFHTAGDAIRAEFGSAEGAVAAALDIQDRLRSRNAGYPLARQMMLRIGVALGDAVDQDGDVHGPSVSLAIALEALASPGGLCISKVVHDALVSPTAERFADMGRVRPAAVPEGVHAFTMMQTAPPRPTTVLPTNEQMALPTSRSRLMQNVPAIGAVVALGAIAAAAWMLAAKTDWPSATAVKPAVVVAAQPSPKVEPKPDPKPAPTSPRVSEPPPTIAAPTPPAPTTPPEPPQVRADAAKPATEWNAVDALVKRQYTECGAKDWQRAITACQALLKDDTLSTADMADMQLNLGRALRETGRTDEAIDTLSSSIKHKASATAYTQRGIAKFEKGTPDAAIEDFTAAIKLNPEDGEAYNNRAWTHFKAGRLVQANVDSKSAVRHAPTAAFVWDTSGHIHEAMGQRETAIADFRRALSIDDKHETSRAALKRLGVSP